MKITGHCEQYASVNDSLLKFGQSNQSNANKMEGNFIKRLIAAISVFRVLAALVFLISAPLLTFVGQWLVLDEKTESLRCRGCIVSWKQGRHIRWVLAEYGAWGYYWWKEVLGF
jgi:hypothetical protein